MATRKSLVGLVSAVALVSVLFAGTALGVASLYAGPAILGQSGAIRGVILCGEEDADYVPREWSTVWVQGLAFSAKTREDGSFLIDYVPPGTYTLGVQTAGNPIRAEAPVIVEARSIADVGEIRVTGGCGQCGGGGGHEDGGGCEDGGDCSGEQLSQ